MKHINQGLLRRTDGQSELKQQCSMLNLSTYSPSSVIYHKTSANHSNAFLFRWASIVYLENSIIYTSSILFTTTAEGLHFASIKV